MWNDLDVVGAHSVLALLLLLAIVLRPAVVAGTTVPPDSSPRAVERLAGPGLDAVGPDGERLGPCPLEHTAVGAEIAGFVTRVRVTHTFSNPFAEPIEAVYTFPLSSDGAVDAMSIRTGDRTIRGQVRRREEARELYEGARREGRLAALLDEERPNVFTQRIANLMPGDSVDVEIEYVESLDYADGRFEFSFPMVVGPRFVPGEPTGSSGTGWAPDTDRVPDASRLTPPVAAEGVRAGHDVSLTVELSAGLPLSSLRSRLHEIEVEEVDATRRIVRLRRQDEIPNRDFVLQWTVAAEELSSGVLVHRPVEEPGFVTFLFVPPERVRPEAAAPREIVFVVDRSGSQAGRPLEHAKTAMLHAIDRLGPRDTFQVISFSNEVEKLFDRPRSVTPETRERARTYVRGLQANGGTMMAEAVREVCAEPAPENRLRIVSFMTDGYVGNDHAVIDLVGKLRGKSRWFPFGTGNATNRYLLDHIAREGGGEVEYVLLDEDPREAAERFYERIAAPVLTDVRLDFEGLVLTDVVPRRIPDLWAHKPLVVHARYQSGGAGRVVLRGFRAGRPWERTLDVDLPDRAAENRPIASMWARARVDGLLARDLRGLQQQSFAPELRAEVERIALAHQLLTPFTSFLAVEERVVNEGGRLRTVTVPVELADGVDRSAVFGDVSATVALSPAGLAAPGGSVRAFAARKVRVLGGIAEESAVDHDETKRGPLVDAPVSEKLGALVVSELERTGVDHEITVRVTLSTGVGPELERELEAAGLRLVVVLDRAVVGSIRGVDLDELVEIAQVERVDLA